MHSPWGFDSPLSHHLKIEDFRRNTKGPVGRRALRLSPFCPLARYLVEVFASIIALIATSVRASAAARRRRRRFDTAGNTDRLVTGDSHGDRLIDAGGHEVANRAPP